MNSMNGGDRRVWAVNCANRYGVKTVTIDRQTGRLRAAALAAGAAAGLAMIVVGCSAVTQGTVTIDKADAPEYRASISSSSAASESRRQVAAQKSAVRASCDALGTTSDASVDAVNAYVQAYNAAAPDASAKAGPAIDSLNTSADAVQGSLSDALPSDLQTALTGWVDAARQLAGVITRTDGPDAFNGAIERLNDSKSAAGARCNAAY